MKQFVYKELGDGPWKEMGLIPTKWLEQEGARLVKSEDEILQNAIPYVPGKGPIDIGIYFLINDDIEYVGISSCPSQRLFQHWRKGWRFKKYSFISDIPRLFIEDYEAFYIHRHEPPRNVKYQDLREPFLGLIHAPATNNSSGRR